MINVNPQTIILLIEHIQNNYETYFNYWYAHPPTNNLIDYLRLRLIQDGFDSNSVDFVLNQHDIYNELSLVHPTLLN